MLKVLRWCQVLKVESDLTLSSSCYSSQYQCTINKGTLFSAFPFSLFSNGQHNSIQTRTQNICTLMHLTKYKYEFLKNLH